MKDYKCIVCKMPLLITDNIQIREVIGTPTKSVGRCVHSNCVMSQIWLPIEALNNIEQLQKRVQELEEEKQAVWKEWLEKMEKKWDEEDSQKLKWIDEGKTLIVKKDGDSWVATMPDFKNLQESESMWFSMNMNEYMDSVYWYLNTESKLSQEEK